MHPRFRIPASRAAYHYDEPEEENFLLLEDGTPLLLDDGTPLLLS